MTACSSSLIVGQPPVPPHRRRCSMSDASTLALLLGKGLPERGVRLIHVGARTQVVAGTEPQTPFESLTQTGGRCAKIALEMLPIEGEVLSEEDGASQAPGQQIGPFIMIHRVSI